MEYVDDDEDEEGTPSFSRPREIPLSLRFYRVDLLFLPGIAGNHAVQGREKRFANLAKLQPGRARQKR